MYNTIVDPETNKQVTITCSNGKKILNHYIQHYLGRNQKLPRQKKYISGGAFIHPPLKNVTTSHTFPDTEIVKYGNLVTGEASNTISNYYNKAFERMISSVSSDYDSVIGMRLLIEKDKIICYGIEVSTRSLKSRPKSSKSSKSIKFPGKGRRAGKLEDYKLPTIYKTKK